MPSKALPPMNVAAHELGPYSPVSEMQILAAAERAQRHNKRFNRKTISHHLGFNHSSGTTRRLRPQLDALRADGSLSFGRKSGFEVWRLTGRGKRRLARARRAGKVPELPESPQHRTWRHAREQAARLEGEVREALSDTLEKAEAAAYGAGAARPTSERLFELSVGLRSEFARLGIVIHCLHEWAEPHDSKKDMDEVRGPAHTRRDYRSLERKSRS